MNGSPSSATFVGLFDDAALFPPGDASMAAAVPAHHGLVIEYGDLVGPFVVPAARLDELAGHLRLDDPPLRVSLIAAEPDLPAAVDRVLADPRLALSAVEVPGCVDQPTTTRSVVTLDSSLPPDIPVAVELPRTASRDVVLDVLAGTGLRAKLRTGGLQSSMFPRPEELADTLRACVAREISFKCTAGLHHAVRRVDAQTGLEHHGLVNVLLAVDGLICGATPTETVGTLGQQRPDVVAAALRGWSADRAARVRTVFTSFGTCSTDEPIAELVALGLLGASGRIPA